jgi:subtilisin family serine protease
MKVGVAAASAMFGFLISISYESAWAATRVPSAARNVYVVVMRAVPAGTRRAADFARRAEHLPVSHDSLLKSVGGARKLYSYSYALNGFAAELNKAQAAQLRADPNVVSVVRNEIRKLSTLTTPEFLELSAPDGAWNQVGGGANAGEDIIVGVIDTGIWPEHPSFAPLPGRDAQAPGWNGTCEPGEEFPASSCNSKLIGARWYNAGFGGDEVIKSLLPYEFLSPRAAEGHGVHTAGIAVGNHLVEAETGGVRLGLISGMAPAARLAVYKACWGYVDDPNGGCSIVDTVAAIDQAVADGVDVINFSVAGSLTSFVDPVEFAFLIAADAGIFVATSAGNEGRLGPSTVQHISPWVTTVGHGTHDRRYKAAVVFANGTRFEGKSLDDTGAESANVVLAADARMDDEDPAVAALCLAGTLNPALTSGRIVICDRGENARLEKSQIVADVGGVGMILVNTSQNTLNADIHAIPTVHLDHVTGAALKRFLARNPTRKALLAPGQSVTGNTNPAPNLVADSSRGPALGGGGDLLKPDLIAPGTDILAAHSPVRIGLDYEFLTGSSMSSAVVAGIAAVLKQAHPHWSPAAIKSALMTTATPRRNDGQRIREDERDHETASVFGIGAGLVQPTPALDPGLVYDSTSSDWLQFICGVGDACFPPLDAIDPSDLNYPSIAISGLVGVQTVRRTVTNVGQRHSRYTASVQAPVGFSITVFPSALSIAPGDSQTFEIRVARTTASLDRYSFGTLTWSDGIHQVRSTIAMLPQSLGAPTEVLSTGAPLAYNVEFGYNGLFQAAPRGLTPADRVRSSVLDDPANEINTALATGRGVVIMPIEVSRGTTYARFALFDSDTDGDDDLDLYIFDPNNSFVASSVGNTSTEQVNLIAPAPGRYLIVVHGFSTDGPDAEFTLSSWLLDRFARENMAVSATPRSRVGQVGTVEIGFANLEPGVRYLGSVAYPATPAAPHPSLIRVDP